MIEDFEGNVEYFITKLVKKYKLPVDEIEELNQRYEEEKEKLQNLGHRLAGRIESELEITNMLPSLKIYNSFVRFMDDYINHSIRYELLTNKPKNLTIIGSWINDMKEGEYNPVHVHNTPYSEGWSCVLFLKIPELINDAKHKHKFHDGQLCFLGYDRRLHWVDPKVGDFYLFRANQMHTVYPFKTKIKGKIRRSMSFNIVEHVK